MRIHIHLAPLLLIAACGTSDTGGPGVACDASAAVSVAVDVVDPSGAPIADAAVTYEADGRAEEACDKNGDTWLCGYEVSGDIAIRVEADGYEPAEQTVTVPEGECHVEGQSVTVTLEPQS